MSRHQDRLGKGAALSDADQAEDMDLIEELGANTIRFAHYQHARKWFDLADQRGMIVWAEMPYVSMASFDDSLPTPELVENSRQQLTELIRQNYNHPSVAVWGVGNEVDSKALFSGKAVKTVGLLKALHELAKAEDPSRLTTFADCCAEAPIRTPGESEPLLGLTDAVGFNRYPGWYSTNPGTMGATLDRLHARIPSVPMSISEYGAGGALTQHSDNARGGAINAFGRPHPVEYQSWVHEENWRSIRAPPYLWATWVWNMFDFASDFRAEGDAIDLNDKGLITFDRKVRKDAFYFYKANWSSEPVLHINGKRYVHRAYPAADLQIYSNAETATLKVNNLELGSQPCPERICIWRNVALRPGENRIVASASFGGRRLVDAITLAGPDADRDGIRINAGYLAREVLPDGRVFGSDNFFTGGSAKALNPKDVTALFERHGAKDRVVAGTNFAVLFDGYREGRFTYEIPLPDGQWHLKLTTFEPEQGTAGQRTFSVSANGRPVLPLVDPFAAAGGSLKAAEFKIPVTAEGGRLNLAFEPVNGPAIVAAIEITR